MMNSQSKKNHKCHFDGCLAVFSRPYKLELHLYKHKGEKNFVCDIEGCLKAYTTPSHLRRHKCNVHEKTSVKNEILCKSCGLTYSNKYSFRQHFNRTHEFPFKCSDCSKTFKKKRQLSEHMTIHTGEILYRCEICNNGFNKVHLLNKHKKNHKTYTCDCGETFSRWSIFCVHRKNVCTVKVIDHTCIICNKTFTTKSNLRAHTLTHVDESQQELFNCPFKECSRSYHYKKNLNHHIKTFHEKARNTLELNCTEPGCQAVLSSYVCLKRHYINVHKSKFKRKSARRVRRDKGKPKKAMIELLLGKHLSDDNRNAILQSQKTEMDLGHTKKKKSKSHENNGCINKMFSTAVKNGTELNLTDKSSQYEEYTGNFIWEPGDEFSNEKLSDCRSKVIDDCSHSIQEEPTILDKDDSIKNSLQIEINVKSSQEIAEVSSNNDDFDLILLRECAETLERLKRCIG